MQNKRHINLSVYDYEGNKLCDLYDSMASCSGQAVNVHATYERNGWKE